MPHTGCVEGAVGHCGLSPPIPFWKLLFGDESANWSWLRTSKIWPGDEVPGVIPAPALPGTDTVSETWLTACVKRTSSVAVVAPLSAVPVSWVSPGLLLVTSRVVSLLNEAGAPDAS